MKISRGSVWWIAMCCLNVVLGPLRAVLALDNRWLQILLAATSETRLLLILLLKLGQEPTEYCRRRLIVFTDNQSMYVHVAIIAWWSCSYFLLQPSLYVMNVYFVFSSLISYMLYAKTHSSTSPRARYFSKKNHLPTRYSYKTNESIR